MYTAKNIELHCLSGNCIFSGVCPSYRLPGYLNWCTLTTCEKHTTHMCAYTHSGTLIFNNSAVFKQT